MTFEQMKDVVKSYCNLPSGEADIRIGRSLNRHYKRITAKCGLDATRFVTRTMITTNGVQTVTFSEIERIDRILDTTSGVDPLTETSLEAIRTDTPGTGAPRKWAKQTTTARTFTVRLDTVPQTPYTLQADGWTTLSDLTGSSDEPVFPESFHDILPWSVIAEELLKKEKDKIALKYEAKAEQLLDELQQHYAESYSQVFQARSDEARSGIGSGSGGTGSSALGGSAYTQTANIHFDLGAGIAPFTVVAGAAKVAHFDADTLDGLEASDFLSTAGHVTSHQNGGSDEINVTGLAGLLADGQTPLAHAASHLSGAGDAIKLDDLATPDDNTDLNATTGHHGLLKKLSGTATEFLNGAGNFATPNTVAGSDTYVQYNDSGVLGANAGLTFDDATGVLGIGSGIAFPATQSPSTNANTLDDYEENSWTPTDQSGAALSFSSTEGSYVKIGQLVTVACSITFPATASTAGVVIGGLPFTVQNTTANMWTGLVLGDSGTAAPYAQAIKNTTTFAVRVGGTTNAVQNVDYTGNTIQVTLTYRATA